MSKKKKTIEELLEEAIVTEEEQAYEVPDNWIWVRTETTNDIVTGSTPAKKQSEYYGGDFPFVKPADLEQGSEVVHASEYLTDQGKAVSRIIPKESTMVCCIGSIGKVGFSTVECTTNQQINSLVPNKKMINPKFNYYQVLNGFYQNELWNRSSATTVSIINKGKMCLIPYVLPPLNEQKRIAEKVERLLSKIEEAKQLIEEAKETFELRRAAILDKAFRGELTRKWREENLEKILISSDQINSVGPNNKSIKATSLVPEASIPDTWKWVLSNELFSFITSGSRGWAKYYSDDGDLFLRVGNLKHESIDIDLTNRQNVSPPEGTESTRTLVQEGDILVSITADVGRIAVVPKQFPKAYINQHIALARPSSGYCIEYVAWFLSSRNGGRLQFDRLQRGATKAGLGLNDVKNVWLPVPSLEEQYEIVRKIQSAFNKFEVAEKSLTNTLEVYEELKKSILGKAFRGELGTNDPSEENAIELLKEVLQEQVK
ncbi:restriction endonuclease subunit S [Bacillus spizizenii]|uniref:restriction endonuclease subunit S n=1 Tax=Bacillus spizizenii TaxID=96241 RepID=UPI0005CB74D5|nr:restriction endonuclease subunit S [Bacillus spizizenii]MCY8783379.1 restriction endonuclease subunit S [Bacillus spizizenii]